MNKTLGVVLLVLGIIGLGWGAFSFTTQKHVADIGPIHANKDREPYSSHSASRRRCASGGWNLSGHSIVVRLAGTGTPRTP